MQMTLTREFYETHLAPGFSSFSGADLEDLSSTDVEQEHWLSNFVHSQISHEFKPVFRELIFNFIRRAHGAFDAYGQLREKLAAYPPRHRAARTYFSALSHAEVCVSFTAQAVEITHAYMLRAKCQPTYQCATKTQLDLLHRFYRGLKHIPGMLAGSQFSGQDTMLFWFTAEGLQSRKRGLLTYQDLAALLKELAFDARLMSSWAPSHEP